MDPALELPPGLETRPTKGDPGVHEFDTMTQSVPDRPDFTGLTVLPDFLTKSEAAALVDEIESRRFSLAQSGKKKQHYGVKFNFNKKKLNAKSFRGLPGFATRLEARLRSEFLRVTAPSRACQVERIRALAQFQTTDVFVLRYDQRNQSNLDLHMDDTFAYGEAIFDVSLETDTVMTFIRDEPPESSAPSCIRVPLRAGSAALLVGSARFEWQHGILHYDITQQRTSVTLRTLSAPLRETAGGQSVLEIARREID